MNIEYGTGKNYKNKDKIQCIYVIKNEDNHYKIGISKDALTRKAGLQVGYPGELELIYSSDKTSNALLIEKHIHEKYKKFKIKGEWFNFANEEISSLILYISNYVKENGELKITDHEKSKEETKKFFTKYFKMPYINVDKKDLNQAKQTIFYLKSLRENIKNIDKKKFINNDKNKNIRDFIFTIYDFIESLDNDIAEIYREILKSELFEFEAELFTY